jgi:hypothetical protein
MVLRKRGRPMLTENEIKAMRFIAHECPEGVTARKYEVLVARGVPSGVLSGLRLKGYLKGTIGFLTPAGQAALREIEAPPTLRTGEMPS